MSRVNRFIVPLAAAALALPLAAAPALAGLTIRVDKSNQTMTVSQDGRFLYRWPVSTGRAGLNTPSGSFKPTWMDKDHRSQKYDNAPMPHAIFFTKTGDAIHGTYEQKWLGNAVSHGCVRISPQHAAILWKLVKQAKMANTHIVLSGSIPRNAPLIAHNDQNRYGVQTSDGQDQYGQQDSYAQQDSYRGGEDVASAAPRYPRRWGNDGGYAGNSGRYSEDEGPAPTPPAYVG
ncbi:MAG TPA: L,D-transpeptidase, partial [Pseudolabrys sp.]|nr:L,D-transpeptidase [Pseudolabrys sp.]